MNGVSVPFQETLERSLERVLHGINSEKPATCGVGSGSSPDTKHASTFILDFLASWWCEIRFFAVYKAPVDFMTSYVDLGL